jgi:hypothetical protein
MYHIRGIYKVEVRRQKIDRLMEDGRALKCLLDALRLIV